MNKLINSMALMFMSVMMFAQDGGGAGNPDNPSDYIEPDAPGNPALTPIDDYTFALIAMAVLIIAYVVYKQRQAKTA